MNKEDLRKATGLSSSTIAKLSKDESVMLDVVDRICKALNCDISDVVSVQDPINNCQSSPSAR